MSKDLSKYIHPKHLPANFEIHDLQNMKQDQIIFFFEHIAARQQANSSPDIFQFKTAKVGRKGNKTFDEQPNRNDGDDSEFTDDNDWPIALTDHNANANHNHPHPWQTVSPLHPQFTLTPHYNTDSPINQNGSPNPKSHPGNHPDTNAVLMLIVVPNIITDDLIEPVLLIDGGVVQQILLE